MTPDEATAIIQEGLGFRTDLATQIVAKLNETMRLLERGRSLPKFLIQEDETLTLVAEQNYLALPDGFLKEVDDDFPHFATDDTGDIIYLAKGDWDQLQQIYIREALDNTPQVPAAFSIRKNRIYFAPTPGSGMELTWSYYKAGTTITAGGAANEWLADSAAPYLLVGKAGLSMARSIGAKNEVLTKFTEMFMEWDRAIFSETVEQESNGPVIMGSNL